MIRAGGAMGWRPADIRACVYGDFIAAYFGFLASKGVDPTGEQNDGYPTSESIRRLSIRYG